MITKKIIKIYYTGSATGTTILDAIAITGTYEKSKK
jgi:hypothetical protein